MKYRLCWGLVIFVITSLLLAGCGSASKTKNYTIGVINPSLNQENTVKGFKTGLAELGYIEGQNVTYIYNGPVNTDQLDAAAQDMVKAKVDLILTITTPATLAAKQATAGTNIPVVFIPVTDPVKAGLVENLMRPGGNITGITSTAPEGKRLEWLLQVSPNVKHVYVVYNPNDQSPIQALERVRAAAAKLDVEVITRQATTPEETKTAFTNIPQEVDAIFFLPDYVSNANIADSLKQAAALKLPTSGPNVNTVVDGALTGYGLDLGLTARKQAARLTGQILQGAKPAELPVETAEFYSSINLKTAQSIGLDIPDEVLQQANIIIR